MKFTKCALHIFIFRAWYTIICASKSAAARTYLPAIKLTYKVYIM